MKRKGFLLLLITILSMCSLLVGCGSEAVYLDKSKAVRVVYELEGGMYKNSAKHVTHYYGFEKGTGETHFIKDIAAEKESDRLDPKATVTRAEYTLDGWYRTRTEEGGRVVYSDKWDFKTDKVGDDGVKLYAKWNRIIRFTFSVYYKDENEEEVYLGRYNVDEGEAFSDYLRYAGTRIGYTPVGFTDAEGNPIKENDASFVHPGGKVSTDIKVYVLYERGEFVRVSTAEQLNANKSRDIKLDADIDFNGEEFSGFYNYGKILDGKGEDGVIHTIKNFKLTYRDDNDSLSDYEDDIGRFVLGISLFGAANNAVIRNVKFENVIIDINTRNSMIRTIIVAPLCITARGCTFENVSFGGTYKVTQLPKNFTADNIIVVKDKVGYKCDTLTEIQNFLPDIDDQITL